MEDYFIQKVIIKDVRDIKNLEIPLDDNERKHLIITGKNGCGKTSTLLAINNLLNRFIKNGFSDFINAKKDIRNCKSLIITYSKKIKKQKEELVKINNIEDIEKLKTEISIHKHDISNWKKQIERNEKTLNDFSQINLDFSNHDELHENIVNGKFILAYFEAKRENQPIVPTSIQNIKLNQKNSTETKSIHKQFISYMVRLRNQLLNEKFDGNIKEAQKIQKWFDNFENLLKELFSQNDLKLKYYNDELNFKVEYSGKSFGLNELSDGYSSLLAIITELILRMEAHKIKVYDMQGVVLIDEIETHLHVALQKKVLPFLTSFFKNIQFIVTTHSPFVLSSLSNAVICDLEKKFVTTDLSGYSYDALIESYFDSDKYSKEVKEKIEIFEKLADRDDLSDSEKDEYYKLKKYFDSLPTFMSDELAVKLNEIKLRAMFKAN